MPKRRTHKRRTYKGMRFRRVGHGPITRIRHASMTRRKRSGMVSYRRYTRGRFPTTGPKGPLVIAEMKHPEREYIRMQTVARNQITPGSLAGVDPNVNSNLLTFLSQTDIENPGSIDPGIWGSGATAVFQAVNGFTQQTELYRTYQPRGCRLNIHITRQIDGVLTVMDNVLVEVCIAPVSNDQIGALRSGAQPFNMIKKLPGARYRTIVYDANLVGMRARASFKLFSSPQKMEANPGYLASTASTGSVGAPPSLSPGWVIAFNWFNSIQTGSHFFVDATLEYSVLWFDRFLPVLSLAEGKGPVSAVVAPARVESKEEKKDDDDVDEAEEAFDRLELFDASKVPIAGGPPKGGAEPTKIVAPPPAAMPQISLTPPPPPPPAKKSLFKPVTRTASGPVKI